MQNNFMYEGADELTGNTHIVQRRPIKSISSLINPVPRDETTTEGTSKHTIHRLLCLDSRFREELPATGTKLFYYTSYSYKNVISMELSALEFPARIFKLVNH